MREQATIERPAVKSRCVGCGRMWECSASGECLFCTNKRAQQVAKQSVARSPFVPQDQPRFVTGEQFQRDILKLAGMIPGDIAAIAGVARSGISVAALLSMHLHLPMLVVRQGLGDVVPVSNGWRLNRGRHTAPKSTDRILVVDDNVMTGNSLRVVRPIVTRHYKHATFASVYCNPRAKRKPDLWAVDLDWPHLLEWNLFNSVLSGSIATDFDGVLCHNPSRMLNEHSHLDFCANAKPLHLPRRVPIPLIVTGRIEKYRPLTLAWLAKHGVRCEKLIMHPAATLAERDRDDIAAFKAKHFAEWARNHRASPGPCMFIESDDRQAKRIGEITGRLVVCPGTSGVYSGTRPSAQVTRRIDVVAVAKCAEPEITGFAAVTSLSPAVDKLDRQRQCVASWKALGLRVVAVQLPGEAEKLSAAFRGVEFVETRLHHERYRRVLITDLANQALRLHHPVMLINSDIEVRQLQADFIKQWVDVPARFLQYGNRWNHRHDVRAATWERWGLDAFRITPRMARQLPNHGFALGLPMWDYWLPWHFARIGYQLRCDPRPVMMHQMHRLGWSKSDHAAGCRVIERHYGKDKKFLDAWIGDQKRSAGALGEAVNAEDDPHTGPRVLFDHLPKCAGSSITNWLKSNFPEDVRFGTHWADPYKSNKEFEARSAAHRYKTRLITGHFTGRLMPSIHPAMLMVTTLREPVDLILSYYHFIRQATNHPEHALANAVSLEEMLRRSRTLRNPLVPYLAGINWKRAEAEAESAVRAAVRRLHLYDLIGYQDDVPGFVSRVQSLTGLSVDYDGARVNVTQSRPAVDAIPECTRRAIEAANQLDLELWRRIVATDAGTGG